MQRRFRSDNASRQLENGVPLRLEEEVWVLRTLESAFAFGTHKLARTCLMTPRRCIVTARSCVVLAARARRGYHHVVLLYPGIHLLFFGSRLLLPQLLGLLETKEPSPWVILFRRSGAWV